MENKVSYKWTDYMICLCPIALILYISNESYAIDFRAFYLAGKSLLWDLNPYLNHINIDESFYGPINSELAYYSGWKYPPLATYLFSPLALLPYELSKNIFNLISIISGTVLIIFSIKFSRMKIIPESILICGLSFPILATISRGQIEIIIVSFAVFAVYLYRRGLINLSLVIITFLSSVKIFPAVIILSFIDKRNAFKIVRTVSLTSFIILALTLILTPETWTDSFITRVLIPWDEVPGKVMSILPEGSGVIKDTMTVKSSDTKYLLHSHYFVFGFANPLLSKNLILASIVGLTGACACKFQYRSESSMLISLTIMNWINIMNPISWIMGITWYIPLFLYSYMKVKNKYKYLLCLPLILPPFLNVSGYLAALLSLIITRLYKQEYLNENIASYI